MKAHSRVTFAALLCAIALLAGCMEKLGPDEVPTQYQFPLSSDPKTIPALVSTYPPSGATGPFANLYAPGKYGPHFTLRFNKMMLPGSFSKYSVHVTGSDGIALPRVSAVANSHPDYTVSCWILAPDGEPYSYRIGVTYKVTIDNTVTDIFDNHLKQPITFSFTPEPYLRVTSSVQPSYPWIPQSGISIFQNPVIFFNSLMPDDVNSFIHISPSVAGHWHSLFDPLAFTDNGNPLQYVLEEALTPRTSYTITVDVGIRDSAGHGMSSPYTSQPFETQLPESFYLRTERPYSYESGTPLYEHPIIQFTLPVDFSTVAGGVIISPAIGSGFMKMIDGFYADSAADLQPNTTYTVTITPKVKSIYGDSLNSEYSYSFFTSAFTVDWQFPYNTQLYVPRTSFMQITFTGNIDTATVASAFTISPHVSGHFSFPVPPQPYSEGYVPGGILPPPFLVPRRNIVYFTPSSPLAANTTYTYGFNTSLRSIGGYPLNQFTSWQFVTGEK